MLAQWKLSFLAIASITPSITSWRLACHMPVITIEVTDGSALPGGMSTLSSPGQYGTTGQPVLDFDAESSLWREIDNNQPASLCKDSITLAAPTQTTASVEVNDETNSAVSEGQSNPETASQTALPIGVIEMKKIAGTETPDDYSSPETASQATLALEDGSISDVFAT
ncbi:hypothetical protein B0T10DRAFT_466012 [Thelonectria olida]|uniref:Uncharacterized protein n=1 Tax=Thelonectria olida TaxID=1576542 RepID=A0A9P9AJ45_9HYPO|nr:hypothetical protein B0T10DRAFT_466012 [Thelonectria olida]